MNAHVTSWRTPADPLDMRRALGCFPTGVIVVTGQTTEGSNFGLTASSFQAVSLAPPLVLFSIRRGAWSVQRLEESRRFCVNVLHERQDWVAKQFASNVEDRFEGVRWTRDPGRCPSLDEAICSFQCRLWATYDGGDHVIVVGEVFEMKHVDAGSPLLFYRGEFRSLAEIGSSGGDPL